MGESGAEEIGSVAGSKPMLFGSAPLKNFDNDIMRTKDIEGAQASTKGLGIFAHVTRREAVKCSLDIKDVPGSNAGSLKKGPTTNRRTNPLLMDYKYPGDDHLEDKNNPFSFHKGKATEASKKAF